jgi:hypothetical protein
LFLSVLFAFLMFVVVLLVLVTLVSLWGSSSSRFSY